jgi:hypothetical protein
MPISMPKARRIGVYFCCYGVIRHIPRAFLFPFVVVEKLTLNGNSDTL